MKRVLAIFAFICGSMVTMAEVKPGENILNNGEFYGQALDQVTGLPTKAPDFWAQKGAAEYVSFVPNKAPAGKGYVHFAQIEPDKLGQEVIIKQGPVSLVAGEKYRLSALVRTNGFESPNGGIVVYDNGWRKQEGFISLPKTQEWTRVSMEFTMFKSTGNFYTVAMFACNFKGSMDVADIRLEAISEKALKETDANPLAKFLDRVTLIPWKPLLNKITLPENGNPPEMQFLFSGKLPEGTAAKDYELRFAVNDLPEASQPLSVDFNTIKFAKGAKPGDFTLRLRIVNRETGKAICEQKHDAAFVIMHKLSSKGHKRLNNLVVELLNKPIEKRDSEQTFAFCTLRDGWVFIAAGNAAAEKLEITLDDKTTVITTTTPRMETFRDISLGNHSLTVKGAANGGNLIVRSIPEIYNYKPCCDSMLPENPKYDWAMQEKYVHPAITTHNGGVIPPEYREDFFARGYKWIANAGTYLRSSDTILNTLNTCDGMNKPQYQGVSCDEQVSGSPQSILPYTDAMKRFVPKNDHVAYTWIGGTSFLSGRYDSDFLSACVNSCHGRGRILSETYCRTLATREEADACLKEHIIDIAATFKRNFPGVMDHWGVIFGNFIQIPVISLAHHTNVDYKYFLDMQFNVIANHPECRDMGITGYWGTRHCDLEMFRWSFMLTRHYCIEGKTTMLSDEYGFTYDPGHLHDGDFANGMKQWTASGNVSCGKKEGYATNSQGRYCDYNGIGDTFAILSKKDAEVSSVSQVAKGLVPGKMYCLQFVAIDYNDLMADKFNPRRVGVDATLGDGAEVDKSQSWLHIDKRQYGQYAQNHNVPKCNLHHIVFKALKPEITVTIHNTAAQKGEAAAVNYVTLNPYLN